MSEPRPISSRAVRQRLESLAAAGVQQLPRKSGRVVEAAAPAATPTPEQPAPPAPPAQAPPPASAPSPEHATPIGSVSGAPTLEILQSEVAGCTACPELAERRTQTVFGVGDLHARLCFMGEAPGADEDRLGEPFVGRAGQLLTKMIEACTLSREEVYILNVLKCRPPGNRDPTPDESRACRRFLTRQLDLIDPEYICCLGRVAAQNFLETTTPIGRLRGQIHNHAGRKVVCTYHPAYLLRNPSAKKDAWADLQMLMAELGISR
ncbi:Uracil DNA glycosylase superfamily protein [Planctomycetes bacterium MalM25]|nr:Uracil DNA glycosylase superfamily protein [Planctomycetes bacterium MalM25]